MSRAIGIACALLVLAALATFFFWKPHPIAPPPVATPSSPLAGCPRDVLVSPPTTPPDAGVAAAELDPTTRLWGYPERLAIPPRFAAAGKFHGGIAAVRFPDDPDPFHTVFVDEHGACAGYFASPDPLRVADGDDSVAVSEVKLQIEGGAVFHATRYASGRVVFAEEGGEGPTSAEYVPASSIEQALARIREIDAIPKTDDPLAAQLTRDGHSGPTKLLAHHDATGAVTTLHWKWDADGYGEELNVERRAPWVVIERSYGL